MKRYLISLSVLALLISGAFTVSASQQDFDISTLDANTGSTMRTAINAAFQALASSSSGVTEPAVKYAYQLWADTTTGNMKIRNSGNTAWISLFPLEIGSTATNTANAPVKRNPFGNFSAGNVTGTLFKGPLTGNVTGNVTGNITGNVTGNATTATTATNASGTGTICKTTETGLRVIRGTFQINGTGVPTVIVGSGWSVIRGGVGRYTVMFTTYFTGAVPTVVVSYNIGTLTYANTIYAEIFLGSQMDVYAVNGAGTLYDPTGAIVSFIAIGPN